MNGKQYKECIITTYSIKDIEWVGGGETYLGYVGGRSSTEPHTPFEASVQKKKTCWCLEVLGHPFYDYKTAEDAMRDVKNKIVQVQNQRIQRFATKYMVNV